MTSNKKYHIKQWFVVVAAAMLYAAAFELFLIPSEVVVGGVTGIAAILDIFLSKNAIYMSAGVWVILINIPIIIYTYLNFSRRFANKTLVFVLLLSVFFLLMRIFDVANILRQLLEEGEGEKVMFTIMGGAISGTALPLMLSVNGSTAGSDIVGLILQKKSKRSSTEGIRAMFFVNILLVAVASLVMAIVKNFAEAINLMIYSIAAIVINEIVQERLFRGFSSAIEVEINTDKPQEMAQALIAELNHSVTFLKVKGGYAHRDKTLILCVIPKRQLTLARRIVHRIDSQSFAYVENVREVIGKGFINKEDMLCDEGQDGNIT